jgi:hypothetical protein
MATHIQSFGPLIAVSAKVKTCIVSRENGDRKHVPVARITWIWRCVIAGSFGMFDAYL